MYIILNIVYRLQMMQLRRYLYYNMRRAPTGPTRDTSGKIRIILL